MTTYKKVRILSLPEAAYLAGLIDGEGTITLTRKTKNANRTIAISISNTELNLLTYSLEIIGAGKIAPKRVTKANHTPAFIYQISGRQALIVIEQILPFLRSYKKERGMLLAKSYIQLTPRNGRYTEELANERELFIKKFFEIRPNENNSRGRVIS